MIVFLPVLFESGYRISVEVSNFVVIEDATAFPVECYLDFAKELSELAGCNPREYFIASDYLQ
ncbi:MAG: hypothetical protein M0P91_10515 [Sulfuricurvum sp.]|jgi:hypothetical protein|uniref:hypothetical protein n=1 Tax=Sulfuricurvum sp. TaxID=2025608 RepID=UPI0025F1007C|nr:hypothetical protein [Sulfuricurvum sp.]MCK9373622.1 hypothetical protein [Sulfuricurvum sp.]